MLRYFFWLIPFMDLANSTRFGKVSPEMKNPFHFNRPTRPEDFLGRWAIVEQIVDDLYEWEGESYGIVGGRRFGKSSMLLALENSLVKRLKQMEIKNLHVLPVYVPLKAIHQLIVLLAYLGLYYTNSIKSPVDRKKQCHSLKVHF